MGMLGTLAKVAIGYAAARGVDRLSDGKGLGAMLGGGAQVDGSGPANPLQNMMGQMMAGQNNPLAGVMDKLKESGLDMSKLTGGGDMGKMLAGLGGAGGLAGMAAMQGKGLGALFDGLNTGTTAPDAEAAAALMLRAMIQSAKADGGIDADEQAKLMDAVGDDADAADIAFVKEQLAADVDVDALAAATPPAMALQVYSASLMTIRVDTPAEAEYLDTLAKALNLDESVVNNVHLGAGLQPLYR